jgi:hypothetical protein
MLRRDSAMDKCLAHFPGVDRSIAAQESLPDGVFPAATLKRFYERVDPGSLAPRLARAQTGCYDAA